jgi:hypothetical protein
MDVEPGGDLLLWPRLSGNVYCSGNLVIDDRPVMRLAVLDSVTQLGILHIVEPRSSQQVIQSQARPNVTGMPDIDMTRKDDSMSMLVVPAVGSHVVPVGISADLVDAGELDQAAAISDRHEVLDYRAAVGTNVHDLSIWERA